MKNSRITRALSLLLALAMVCALVAGCSGSGETKAPAATEGGQSSETPSATDNGGKKVKGSITVMVYDRGLMPSSEGTADDNRWANWIKENAPVDVKFVNVARAEATETLTSLFAAGEAPDLIVGWEDFSSFYKNGCCLEITDEMLATMPNYSKLLELHPSMEKTAMVDGEFVYLTRYANIGPNHAVAIRTDWLENLGLEMPKTPEDLYNIIYQFTYNDPDGNGVDDTWGISMTSDSQRMLSHMFGYPNPEKYVFDENGDLVVCWDRMQGWLEFVKKIVDNKLCNPDFVTMKADDDQADFINGKIGVYMTGRFTNANRMNLWNTFKAQNPDATVGTFALPVSEFGQYSAYLDGGPSSVGFINSATENVEGVLAYVDWLYSAETTKYLLYGPDGVYNQMNADGTFAVVDAAKNEIEFNYASDYCVVLNQLLEGGSLNVSPTANMNYNVYLASDDPIVQEFGKLQYEMALIANDPNCDDPRKWITEGFPNLPTELDLIKTVATKDMNNIISAAVADSSITAEQAIQNAKDAWYNAGGQKVDDWYDEYYKAIGENTLLASDYTKAKSEPVLTSAAKKNLEALTNGN